MELKKPAVLQVLRALKPADWIIFIFAYATLPVVAANAQWVAIIWRAILPPIILASRTYLVRKVGGYQLESRFTLTWQNGVTFLLDAYPLIMCIYVYGEDGASIRALYPSPENSFWDDALKAADSNLTGAPVETGVGKYMREATSLTFNRIFGEYLHFCYFFFYVILAGTYLLAWALCPREHFDRLATAEVLTYMVCLSFYLVMPAVGPYWAYPDSRPEPGSVGFVFSRVTHFLVEGGSSAGTAFPSGHCAITTCAFITALIYMRPLGIAYIFVCPGLVFATVWCGFHYVMDAMVGVMVGSMCTGVGIAWARVWRYDVPAWDSFYTEQFKWSRQQYAREELLNESYAPLHDGDAAAHDEDEEAGLALAHHEDGQGVDVNESHIDMHDDDVKIDV